MPVALSSLTKAQLCVEITNLRALVYKLGTEAEAELLRGLPVHVPRPVTKPRPLRAGLPAAFARAYAAATSSGHTTKVEA